MPAKNFLNSETKEKLQRALKEHEHPDINRLFESLEKLELVLNDLLNEGGLIIKWDRKLKNKGNAVNVI